MFHSDFLHNSDHDQPFELGSSGALIARHALCSLGVSPVSAWLHVGNTTDLVIRKSKVTFTRWPLPPITQASCMWALQVQ